MPVCLPVARPHHPRLTKTLVRQPLGPPCGYLNRDRRISPRKGLVIGRGGDLLFLTTDGDTLASLDHVRLYYEWTVPGPVVVRRGGTFYQLNIDRGVLESLASRDTASDLSPQFQSDIDLPMPPHDDAVDMAGRWAFVLPDANGTSKLAMVRRVRGTACDVRRC